ncbi:MAG: NAD(P)H-hydrate dehydratase [Deltaproteobacteria bacterium]|nr:NAD(P)H-hydrate dehydratase [Deltaproteobacteria bacterium]
MKLPYASEMRELDRSAIEEYGIPGMVLMENAGLGTVLMMEKELGPAADSFALILIGPGNNGGDGLVIGRHLHQRGCKPVFIFLVAPETLQGDAAGNLHIVKNLALPLHVLDSAARVQTLPALYRQLISTGKSCYAIIDALFGTGLTRAIDGHVAELIRLITTEAWSAGIPRIAVDIPSGLHADTGRIQGVCIPADHTATYGCAKPGQLLEYGLEVCGRLHVIDIGIPPAALAALAIEQEALTNRKAACSLAKIKRSTTSHKGSNGHLLVLAGSIGKTGAAILSVKGALRSGCGLVSLCCPQNLNAIFETRLVEAMTIPLPASNSTIGMEDLATIEQHLSGKKAVVLGPGLGMAEQTAQLVLHLYHTVKVPMVIDADALNILASYKNQLQSPPGPRIFTPHPGEMARILGISVAKVQEDRIQAARKACLLFDQSAGQCTVILKGAGTVIVSEGGKAWINTTGNPGMATGGTGDVLSGIIGSLICQGLSPQEAARAAVYLHGMAGDLLQDIIGTGYSATELADTLPRSIKQLNKQGAISC